MQFFRRAQADPSHLGIFPGAFNPVTLAHLEIVQAALSFVDEVVFVLPRVFPHKLYVGATFEDRVQMLQDATARYPKTSIAAADRGLFIEIARECRKAYSTGLHLTFLCGRDAAERIVAWDYGRPGAFREMLREFQLLVAARDGEYTPPAEYRQAIRTLPIAVNLDEISASEVRERIATGQSWQHLVPAAIRRRVEEIYAQPPATSRVSEEPPDSTPGM